jgi:hypothetical protein
VIVNDLDIVRGSILPSEADPPLIINPNTELARSISMKFLESIARRHSQVVNRLCGVDGDQLAQHHPPELRGIAADGFAGEQPLGGPVAEAFDHEEP